MKKYLLLLIILLVALKQTSYAQSIMANPKSNEISAKKIAGQQLLIPVDLDLINPSAAIQNATITIAIDNATAPFIARFNATDIGGVTIINNNKLVHFIAGQTEEIKNTFYLSIDKNIIINFDKMVYLKINEGAATLCTVKVTILPDRPILSLDEYMDETKNNKLDYVTKVESNDDMLTVNGYKKDVVCPCGKESDLFLKRTIALKKGEVLAVSEWNWIRHASHWRSIPLSLITIPFKVRPAITANEAKFKTSASSGITNIGFNFDLAKYQIDRYFTTAKKSTHKFSIGCWAAPSVEELDSTYTKGANGLLGKADEKMAQSKQLFISAGITLSYSYNDISFVFVPAGWDFATTTIGKSWVYNKQRWWGFGIAISPKIFEKMLNK